MEVEIKLVVVVMVMVVVVIEDIIGVGVKDGCSGGYSSGSWW